MTRLREIAERLREIATELESGGELEEGRAATLAAEAGELSAEAVGGRGDQPARPRGRRRRP
jgi:hypothetical protein